MSNNISCYFVLFRNMTSIKVQTKIISTRDKVQIFNHYQVVFIIRIPKIFLRLSNDEIINFFKYLKFQITNGIPLQTAVDNFINAYDDYKLVYHAKVCDIGLKSGETFANACLGIIDSNAYNLIRHIERTGDFLAILDYLVSYYTLKTEMYSHMLRKLRLPLISFVFITVVLGVIISYISSIVADITASDSINNFIVYYEAGILLVLLYYALMFTVFNKHVFKDPIIGKILLNTNLWVFTNNLSLCLKAKLNTVESISIAAMSVKNITLKNTFINILANTKSGESFSDLINSNDIFSRSFKDSIKIGENNNSLQETMEKFSKTVYDDLMYDLDKLSSNLSIFLNVFSGIILSTILLNIIGPIYELAEKIENM